MLALHHPDRVRSLVIGGLGVDGVGLPVGIADAMETDRPDLLTDPQQKTFRALPKRPRATARRWPPASADRGRCWSPARYTGSGRRP